MRMWHYKLIPVLPTKQLVSQFRECAAIASMLNSKSLNHYIVNRVKDYPINHFYYYNKLVADEMKRRGFRTSEEVLNRIGYYNFVQIKGHDEENNIVMINTEKEKYYFQKLFSDWHNDRYLYQCLSYFQEKYDCNGITYEEWEKIKLAFPKECENIGG